MHIYVHILKYNCIFVNFLCAYLCAYFIKNKCIKSGLYLYPTMGGGGGEGVCMYIIYVYYSRILYTYNIHVYYTFLLRVAYYTVQYACTYVITLFNTWCPMLSQAGIFLTTYVRNKTLNTHIDKYNNILIINTSK